MILECSGCRKIYRVRDETAPSSQKCPACGGELKTSATSTQSLPSPTRVKELEEKVARLERELQQARSSPASAPSLSQAGGFGFAGADAEAARRAEALDRQLLDQKSEAERAIAEKERALAASQAAAAKAEAERRGVETRIESLEQTHARALEEKQKTLDALDASLASYREKLDAAQKRMEWLDSAVTAERGQVEERLREREESLRAEADRAAEEHRRALADLRSELERQIEEKDRQISEGREVLDREAGERRRLSESVTRLQESLDRTVAEKDQAIASLNASVSSHKGKAESLRKRLGDVEELRKSDQESYAANIRSRDGVRARVAEAGHLASDLDQSLDSVADLLRGLRDRVKRLKGNLSESEAAAAPKAVESPAPSAELAFEPAPRAELSFEQPPAPAPEPEPEPELAPEPTLSAAEEPLVEQFNGRVEAPSSIGIPAVKAEEDPIEEVPVAAAPEPAADAGEDLPLISPPEDEAPAAKAEPPKPAVSDKGRRVTRFSWKKS
ncbi:MAG TPA: hypothetical protein VF950_02065 [Planctomycetota bacterium]